MLRPRPLGDLRGLTDQESVWEGRDDCDALIKAFSLGQLGFSARPIIRREMVADPIDFPLRLPQAWLARVCRKIFPASWTAAVKFPCLENSVTSEPFDSWHCWMKQESELAANDVPPSVIACTEVGKQEAFLGAQRGVDNMKSALPPLIDAGLDVANHFQEAMAIGAKGILPSDDDFIFSENIRFAAASTIERRAQIRNARQSDAKSIRELYRWLKSMSVALRRQQAESLRKVASNVHLALVAVLAIFRWPHWSLALSFIEGSRAVGVSAHTGVFRPMMERLVGLVRHGVGRAPMGAK